MNEAKRGRTAVIACALGGALLASAGWFVMRPSAKGSSPAPAVAQPAPTASAAPAPVAIEGRPGVRALAEDPRGLDGLRERFGSESNAVLREETLLAAASLGSPEAVAWLAAVAQGDDPLASRAGAALGTVSDPGAAPALAALLAGDGSTLVRANAARALGAAGGAANEEQLTRSVTDAAEALRVRQESARSLGRLGARGSVPRLVSLLAATRSDGSEEQLRLSVVEALAVLGGPDAVRALKDFAAGPLTETERAHVTRSLAAQK